MTELNKPQLATLGNYLIGGFDSLPDAMIVLFPEVMLDEEDVSQVRSDLVRYQTTFQCQTCEEWLDTINAWDEDSSVPILCNDCADEEDEDDE